MQHAVIAGLRGHLPPPITAVSVQLRIIASVSFWSAAVKVTSVYLWHKRYWSWGQLIVCPLLLVSVSVSHSNDYYCPRLFSNQKVCTVIVIPVFSSKSKASKLEEHARLVFDKSDVISIDNEHRLQWPRPLILLLLPLPIVVLSFLPFLLFLYSLYSL